MEYACRGNLTQYVPSTANFIKKFDKLNHLKIGIEKQRQDIMMEKFEEIVALLLKQQSKQLDRLDGEHSLTSTM